MELTKIVDFTKSDLRVLFVILDTFGPCLHTSDVEHAKELRDRIQAILEEQE